MAEKPDESKPAEISTGADRLLEIVRTSKEVSMAAAAKTLGVGLPIVEAWANFLEEDGLVTIKYKFTTPYIAIPEAAPAARKRKDAPSFELYEEGTNFNGLKTEIEGMREALSRAAEQHQAGEFGVQRQTYSTLIAKLRNVHDTIIDKAEVSPQKKAMLNELLAQAERSLKAAAAHSAEGRFDEASTAYSKLYTQAKSAIEEIKRLYEQVSALSSIRETTDYNDMIAKAYQLITEGKVEEANEVYERLRFVHENLAKEFVEKKKQMEGDLVKLNKDLAKSVDQINLENLNKARQSIAALLHAGDQLLKKGDFARAESCYLAIRREYDTLPQGFAAEKKKLQQDVLDFYSLLSKQREKAFRKRFDDATREINSILRQAQEMLKEYKVSQAILMYRQIMKLYSSLPHGFLKEKSDLQERILSLHTAITSMYTKESLDKLKTNSAGIMALLGKMNAHIEKGELKEAEEAYSAVKRLYKEAPRGFLHEETELQNQIVIAYESYLKKTEDVEANSITSVISKLTLLVRQAETSILKRDYKTANSLYLSMARLYQTLPAGFAAQKAEIRNKMLRIYKDLLSLANENDKTLQGTSLPRAIDARSLPKMEPAKEKAGSGTQSGAAPASEAGSENLGNSIENIEEKIEELKSISKANNLLGKREAE